MDSIFAAAEPNLGYLYQIRYGLLLILKEENDEAKLLIEKIDDISIDRNTQLDVYQTKLHINSVANLTNASPDLWKTIRVWSEGIKNGQLNPERDWFNLITTASASPGTIPFNLKQDTLSTRDADAILSALLEVARTSTNITNKEAYDSFQTLTSEQQKSLIKRIAIIDASISIRDLKDEILYQLRMSAFNVNALFERLEGWFLNSVILQLLNERPAITCGEIKNKILDISDCLKVDNLPNDFSMPIAADETQLEPYRHYRFVKQLQLIHANNKIINIAISDYHRAFSQKSRWIREGLISPSDEIDYHNKLKEDWDRKSVVLSDYLTLDEASQVEAGKSFYVSHYINTFPQIHIKDRFREQYMVTGCCQDLSDRKNIGWHPNYINKL